MQNKHHCMYSNRQIDNIDVKILQWYHLGGPIGKYLHHPGAYSQGQRFSLFDITPRGALMIKGPSTCKYSCVKQACIELAWLLTMSWRQGINAPGHCTKDSAKQCSASINRSCSLNSDLIHWQNVDFGNQALQSNPSLVLSGNAPVCFLTNRLHTHSRFWKASVFTNHSNQMKNIHPSEGFTNNMFGPWA